MPVRSDLDVITEFLDPKISRRVGRIFELMDIAHEELARVGVKRPGDILELWPGVFSRYPDELYRAHCRELCERMRDHRSTLDGTDAEALLAMMNTSLEAPLNPAAAAVYEYLFARLMPEAAAKLKLVPRPGIHPGQVEDDVAALKRRLSGTREICGPAKNAG